MVGRSLAAVFKLLLDELLTLYCSSSVQFEMRLRPAGTRYCGSLGLSTGIAHGHSAQRGESNRDALDPKADSPSIGAQLLAAHAQATAFIRTQKILETP
jgi:hypothetical protein